MSPAVASSLGIVAYLALFAGVGLLFIFANLFIGRFLRPSDPNEEKQEIYECGEPTIGSSFVQFDLRFYVIALLFIIFDVEVAFFFPWATVFGKTTNMMDKQTVVATTTDTGQLALTKNGQALYREMGVRNPAVPSTVPPSLQAGFQKQFPGSNNQVDTAEKANYVSRRGAKQLAWITIADIGVFFAVLLVGFAYVWRRGDLDWVRSTSGQQSSRKELAPAEAGAPQEGSLSV